MAVKLSWIAVLLGLTFVLTGCDQQVGPNDKTVSGKEYKDLVNQGVPEDEKATPKKN